MKPNKPILLLLTPSWVSNLLGVFVGLSVTIATIVLARYQGSQLREEIFEVHSKDSSAKVGSYHTITTNIANNHILGVAPLFIVWAGVGLVVYFFAVSIISALGNVVAWREQMGYVNASRSGLIKTAITQLIIRSVALAVWFGFIKISLSVVLPYCLAAAHAASANLTSPSNLAIALLAAVILFADIYVHAVLFRLVLLRPRVFSSAVLS